MGKGGSHSTSVDNLVPRLDLRQGILDFSGLGGHGLMSKEGEKRELVNGEDARDHCGASDKHFLRREDVWRETAWPQRR